MSIKLVTVTVRFLFYKLHIKIVKYNAFCLWFLANVNEKLKNWTKLILHSLIISICSRWLTLKKRSLIRIGYNFCVIFVANCIFSIFLF